MHLVHGWCAAKTKNCLKQSKVKDRSHFVKSAMGQVGKVNIVRRKKEKICLGKAWSDNRALVFCWF